MTFLFIVVNLSVIFFLARKEWKRSALNDGVTYWSGLALRLIGGLSIGLIYKFYYHSSGDTFVFFNDASIFSELFYSNPVLYFDSIFRPDAFVSVVTSEPRSLFFVKLVSVINIITYHNYWITSLWLSLLAFICSYRLVVKLDSIFPSARIASRVALLFVPSVVFWSSGIIKESLAFSAVALIAIHFLSMIRSQKLKAVDYISLAVAVYLLLSLKYYWGAVLIPSIATSLVVYWALARKNVSSWTMTGVCILVFTIFLVAASFTHPNFYMERFLSVIVENHDKFVSISRPENLIEFNNLSATWTSIAMNSPWALWSGLFRPMIFETSSLAGIIAGVENLFLLGLVVWKLKFIRMPLTQNRLIVMAAIVYVVVLCIFLALSTPNLGTLSRYRVGFLSFFVLLILNDHPALRILSKWKIQS